MRFQKLIIIFFLFFGFIPFNRALAQSPSTTPSPSTTRDPEPTPFDFETIPGNTAVYTGIGGEDNIFDKIRQRVFQFQVIFTQMINGKEKIIVPNFEKWGKWMEASVFPDSENSGGPLIPSKLKVRIPQKKEGNNLQIQDVHLPCSSESDEIFDKVDADGKPIGQKKGTPKQVTVSQPYDDYAYNYITGCSILMGLFGAQKDKGTTVSMPSLNINTPEQAVYREENGKLIFKEELKDLLLPCNANSKGRKVQKTAWDVASGGLINAGSLNFYKDLSDRFGDFWDGAGNCLKSPAECLAAAKQAFGLGIETTIWGPGLVGLNACWRSMRASDIPSNVDPKARRNLESYKGIANTFLTSKSAGRLPASYDDRHGTVNASIGGADNNGAPQPSSTPVPYSGIKDTNNAADYTQCAILPNRLQPTVFPLDDPQSDPSAICNPVKDPGTMYSSDANLGTFPPDYNNGIPPVSGDFGTALKNAANSVGIPACVLQGVAFLEGGGRYPEKPLDQCLREVNYCSAAGPMQFTTGTGPASDPECTKCPVKYCPNAWASWGAGGNPCNYQDALSAAARKLKHDGPLTGADPKSQLKQILYAGYTYYGSRLPLEQTGRHDLGELGKCSYGQVLYKTCDPSYTCSGKGG